MRSYYKEINRKPLRVKVLSDLHLDVNRDYPFELPKDDEDLVIIAGDLSGHLNITKEWLNKNVHEGIFIEGNHMLYNGQGKALQDLYKDYEEAFPLDSNITFLQNSCKQVEDVIFVGCTLWTNYRLQGFLGTRSPRKYMNDFYYGLYKENDEVESLEPEHLIKEFNESLKYIERVCDTFPQARIVVITHHCPSIECTPPAYMHSEINQAFCSNLESFIKDHGNISHWICGHSHWQTSFEIDDCKIILNARGYCYRDEDKNFDPHLIVEI